MGHLSWSRLTFKHQVTSTLPRAGLHLAEVAPGAASTRGHNLLVCVAFGEFPGHQQRRRLAEAVSEHGPPSSRPTGAATYRTAPLQWPAFRGPAPAGAWRRGRRALAGRKASKAETPVAGPLLTRAVGDAQGPGMQINGARRRARRATRQLARHRRCPAAPASLSAPGFAGRAAPRAARGCGRAGCWLVRKLRQAGHEWRNPPNSWPLWPGGPSQADALKPLTLAPAGPGARDRPGCRIGMCPPGRAHARVSAGGSRLQRGRSDLRPPGFRGTPRRVKVDTTAGCHLAPRHWLDGIAPTLIHVFQPSRPCFGELGRCGGRWGDPLLPDRNLLRRRSYRDQLG